MANKKIGQGVTTQRKRKAMTAEEQAYEPKEEPEILQPKLAAAKLYLTEMHENPSGTTEEMICILQALARRDEEVRRQHAQPQWCKSEGDVPQGAKDAPEAVIVSAPEYGIRDQDYGGRPGFVVQDDEGWDYPR